MPRRHTHTDIPTLLESEQEAKTRAVRAVRELLALYAQIEASAKEEDRQNYRYAHYRVKREEFSGFLRRISHNRRNAHALLAGVESLRVRDYIPAETLIEQARDEEEARQRRRDRRRTNAR